MIEIIEMIDVLERVLKRTPPPSPNVHVHGLTRCFVVVAGVMGEGRGCFL